MTDDVPPPPLGAILGAAGGPFPIDLPGKTWLVGHPTQAAAERFNKLVKADAARQAQEEDAEMPGLDALGQLRRDLTAGHYNAGGKLWREMLTGPRANVLYLLALLREHHPDATAADAERLTRDAAELVGLALQEVTPPFYDALADLERMPPPVAGALREAAARMRAALPARLPPGAGSTTPGGGSTPPASP